MNIGDVFRYRETLYVYLVEVGDITYAARIVPQGLTAELVRRREVLARNPKNRVHEMPAFCFVVLSTEAFRDQSANYMKPQMEAGFHESESAQFVSALDEEDIQKLKSEIREDVATFKDLRENIAKLGP